MGDGEVLTMADLKNIAKERELMAQNQIILDLNGVLIQKLKEKAKSLNVKIDDLIKIILADRLGVL
jgi:hypothetical protein